MSLTELLTYNLGPQSVPASVFLILSQEAQDQSWIVLTAIFNSSRPLASPVDCVCILVHVTIPFSLRLLQLPLK
jgi:hypothetical protein